MGSDSFSSSFFSGAGSGLIGGVLDWMSQGVTRKSVKTANNLEEQRFNRMMEAADTAHQREVTDLRAAGLNPVLSASGGSGSPIGASSMGSAKTYTSPSYSSSGAQFAATIANAAKLASEGKISKANARVADSIARASDATAHSNAQTAANNAVVSGIDAAISSDPNVINSEKFSRISKPYREVVDSLRGVVGTSANFMGNQGKDLEKKMRYKWSKEKGKLIDLEA